MSTKIFIARGENKKNRSSVPCLICLFCQAFLENLFEVLDWFIPMTNETTLNPQIEEGWKKALREDFGAEYMKELKKKLEEELKSGVIIYPPPKQIFNAFNLTLFDKVKVVILGQDPYHGRGQAHGLSFSVPNGVNPPPSFVNIFKEIESDLAVKPPKTKNGNLEDWANQGVLLLNAILTVRANSPARHRKHELGSGVEGGPASHRNLGWEKLTNAAIKALSDKRENIVFLLWEIGRESWGGRE